MLWSRLLDAIITRLQPGLDAAITRSLDARRDADRKQIREMVSEMDDVLEKFSRVVARQARRRARDMAEVLEPSDAAAQAKEPDPGHRDDIPADLPAAERKRLLRQRLSAGGLRVPRRTGTDDE